MNSIAKKPRSVKRQKGTKKPPRFTIKKDSLGRRYAIDKRTGKRAPIFKAEKERKSRKKVAITFRGITDKKRSRAAKKGWETRKRKSEAAKKGWETRRKKAIIEPIKRIPVYAKEPGKRPPTFAEETGALIPEGMRMHIVGGLADRAELYEKVANAAQLAWIRLELDARRYNEVLVAGRRDLILNTPRFDRLYGDGHGTFVRYQLFAHATDLEDIDQIINDLDEAEDNDYVSRELYTLYFSPEVA